MRLGAEFAGTFALVTLGPGAAAATAGDSSFGRLLLVAAVFGAVVAGSIFAFGRASGSHINPAVTVAHVVRDGHMDRTDGLYLAAQLAAGIAAGALLSLLFTPGGGSGHLGSTSLAEGVAPGLGLVLEILGTFVLALAALSWGKVIPGNAGQAGAMGLTLFVLIVLIGPSTGASFNPARSVGPALGAAYFDNLGLYIAGPLLGGILAGVVARVRR